MLSLDFDFMTTPTASPNEAEQSSPPGRAAGGGPEQPSPDSVTAVPPRARPEHSSAALAPVARLMRPDTTWDASTKRTVLIVLLVACALIFWISRPVLPILILAWIVSYLLSPIVDTCERLRIPRSVSTIVLYVFFLLLLFLAPILLAPVLINQLSSLYFDVPTTSRTFLIFLQNSVANLPTSVEIIGFDVPIEGVVGQLQQAFAGEFALELFPTTTQQFLDYLNQLLRTATNVVGSTATIGFTLVGGIFNTLLFLLFLFFLSLYMTKDAPLIRRYVEDLFPAEYYSEGVELMRRLGQTWHAFFRGQFILSMTIGVATYASLSLMGMRGALILAILAAALEVLPNIGPVLAMIPAVIIALIQGSATLDLSNLHFALLTIGVYFIIQQLENQLLVPRIIGTSVHLHPVVVLCGVVVGASVGGILGAFLAAPVIASLRLIGSYLHAKLLDYPPFSERSYAERTRPGVFYRRVVVPDPPLEEEKEEVEESDDDSRTNSSPQTVTSTASG